MHKNSLSTINTLLESKAWPFVEAKRILDSISKNKQTNDYVLFETGYGPSGLPHIGTFSEVARTSMVKYAFSQISNIPTKLICFSDDLDGMRKVPSNLPNQEMLQNNLDKPLTSVPDPFGVAKSYGDYMNNKLRSFLDQFNFEYEFYSAAECYRSGMFDAMLIRVLERYDQIMDVMLPSLRAERQASYSPFLPICPQTGKVLQVSIIDLDIANASITYKNDSGDLVKVPVTKGACKLQWKPDFAMRWACMGVNYEMYGKDHRPNAAIYSKICEILGGVPPVQFFYELFLNEAGEKISKSKGNSITVDEWLKYAPIETMIYFIYQSPEKAKRLFFDVIPKNVDEYLMQIVKYHNETDLLKKVANPVYHIHKGDVPNINMFGLTFSLLMNLVAACNTDDEKILLGFIAKYASEDALNDPYLKTLLKHAIAYYHDFIEPYKNFLIPNQDEKNILQNIIDAIQSQNNTSSEELQNMIYEIGMKAGFEGKLKEFFQILYRILLGQNEGPRIGSLLTLLGPIEAQKLVASKI